MRNCSYIVIFIAHCTIHSYIIIFIAKYALFYLFQNMHYFIYCKIFIILFILKYALFYFLQNKHYCIHCKICKKWVSDAQRALKSISIKINTIF